MDGWESVCEDEGFGNVARMAVPGGWIYKTWAGYIDVSVSTSMVFVPKPPPQVVPKRGKVT